MEYSKEEMKRGNQLAHMPHIRRVVNAHEGRLFNEVAISAI